MPILGRQRLAIVGCGAVARLCHLPALAGLGPFDLVVLMDRVGRHAEEAAHLYREICTEGGVSSFVRPRTTDRLDDVLADIDAAVVATATHTHAEVATTLLRAGKHVLLEKPMAQTTAQCERIRAAAETGGAVVLPAHVRRLFPATRWVKQLLDEDRLGTISRIHWSEGSVYSWPNLDGWTFEPGVSGGGLLSDIGPHVFDTLCHWLGRRCRVIDFRDNSDGGADSEAEIRLDFTGVTVDVELSRLRQLANQIVIEGSRRTLHVGVARQADYVEYDQSGRVVCRGQVPVVAPAQPDRKGLFRRQLVEFVSMTAGRAGPLATFDDGLAAVELITRCRAARSAELARPWRSSRPVTHRRAAPRTAVTGATGFLGSAVTELLLRQPGANTVVGLARSVPKTTPLSHLDRARLHPAYGDIRDATALTTAFHGCDVVVHTAYGNHGTGAERWAVTVDGTAAVLAAAAKAGVRRVVHVSTMAVYDTADVDMLHEDVAYRATVPGELSYAQQKLAAERLVMQSAGDGPEVVCVQPGVVYGPWGPVWTMRPLQNLRTSNESLPSGPGGGVCNAVHVHDLAEAVVFLATAPAVDGVRVLVAGPAPVGWGTFYDHYRDMLGVPRHGRWDSQAWPERTRELYRARAVISTKRLTTLGFAARTDLGSGMAQVARWASWAGLL